MRKRRFMVDTNVFIAAFKSGRTRTTDLLLKLLTDPGTELIVDDVLISEYRKWFAALTKRLPRIRAQATDLLNLILAKARLASPDPEHIDMVMPHIPKKEVADAYHAATCLKTGAVLITNDKDFLELKKRGIIKVWTITEAIQELLNNDSTPTNTQENTPKTSKTHHKEPS